MEHHKKQYISLSAIITIIPIINILWIHSLVIGTIFGVGYITWWSFAISSGGTIYRTRNQYINFILSLFILLSLFIAAGYSAFYLYKLTPGVIAGILILIPLLISLKNKSIANNYSLPVTRFVLLKKIKQFFTFHFSLFTFLHLTITAIAFIILFQSQTGASIRSPWESAPKEFFIIYFLATMALISPIILKNKKLPLTGHSLLPVTLFQISLHTFLTASAALVVYKVGFGFDPFIHRATEKLIIDTGTISPKPFMYIGQYALITILHHLTQIPFQIIDKILVPLLGSIFLPPIIFSVISSLPAIGSTQQAHKYSRIFTALLLILLPFSFLIVTVPQNLANIILIILIFLGFGMYRRKNADVEQETKKQLAILWSLSLITIFIHPLSGIPAFIFASMVTLLSRRHKSFTKKLLVAGYSLLVTAAIPIFFILASIVSTEFAIKFSNQPILSLLEINAFSWLNGYSLLHYVYFYALNSTLIFFTVAIIGIFPPKKKFANHLFIKIFHPSLITFFILLANIFFLRFIKFSSLPAHEQGEFANRLWQISLLFLLPYFAIGVIKITRTILKSPLQQIILVSGYSLLITANIYLWYPRVDSLTPKNRGFSTSISDISAVRWIENDAKGEDYIVLANQSVSAAALQELGFKKYYIPSNRKLQSESYGNIFFYPIPTGGELYRYYLKMVYESPSKKTIKQAMDLAGVRHAYFVINDYWLDSDKIKTAAYLEADSSYEINKGEVTIFGYKK